MTFFSSSVDLRLLYLVLVLRVRPDVGSPTWPELPPRWRPPPWRFWPTAPSPQPCPSPSDSSLLVSPSAWIRRLFPVPFKSPRPGRTSHRAGARPPLTQMTRAGPPDRRPGGGAPAAGPLSAAGITGGAAETPSGTNGFLEATIEKPLENGRGQRSPPIREQLRDGKQTTEKFYI